MSDIRKGVRRLFTFALRRPERAGDDAGAELDAMIEEHVAHLVSRGMSRDAARAEALRAAGSHARERVQRSAGKRERSLAWHERITDALSDIRYAARTLRGSPGFSIAIIATLALGIGANATMFGIVDRLLFRPPPMMRDPATVHRLYRYSKGDNNDVRIDRNFAFPTYLDFAHDALAFSDVAAFQTRQVAVGSGDVTRERPVTTASASFFRFFDAQPALGRFFVPADDSGASPPVAVLGHAYWVSEFGARDVLGEQILVDRMSCTIVGVAPEGFTGMSDQGVPAIYVPIAAYAFSARGNAYTTMYTWSWLEMIARRKSDVTVEAADADVARLFNRSWANANAENPGWGAPDVAQVRGSTGPVQMERGPQAGRESRVATWIAGVAFIVLLIACANVTNLLLSRAVKRRREVAVRLALGVSRARLARQLLTESLLLALMGGAGALAIAQWGAAGLRAWFIPGALDTGAITDPRTLAFAAVATMLAAVATGLAPVFDAGRQDVAAALKAGARDAGGYHSRVRAGLLVFQVALSVLLLVGAGLFMRSLENVRGYRLGYDTDKILFASVTMRGTKLTREEGVALAERSLAASQSLPGVVSAAFAATVPFWSNEQRGLWVPGVDSVRKHGRFILQIGSPDYFTTMGTRIILGRAFDASDRQGAAQVMVVSEGMAKGLWGSPPAAIGKCVRIDADTVPCHTVVGVSEEMHARNFSDAREFAYYVSSAQWKDPPYPQIFVRTAGPVAALAEPLRKRLQAEMPGNAYVTVRPLSSLVDPRTRSWRLGAAMFVAFGGLALLLAALGLYSLIAYDVAQRRREIGIRMALGATVARVTALVLSRGVGLIAAGIVIGGAVAFWAAQWTGSLLFQQSPRDPAVFGAVAGVLLAVGAAASAAPAFRAARVDPTSTLRED